MSVSAGAWHGGVMTENGGSCGRGGRRARSHDLIVIGASPGLFLIAGVDRAGWVHPAGMRRGSGVTETQLVQSLPSITLAVIAAFCFAGAAVLQHRAVAAEPPDRGTGTLSLRGLREVSRRPGW